MISDEKGCNDDDDEKGCSSDDDDEKGCNNDDDDEKGYNKLPIDADAIYDFFFLSFFV